MIKNPLVRPLLVIIMRKMERWADMIPVIGVWIVLRFFGISQVTTLAVAAAMVCVEILARLSAIERKLQQFEAGLSGFIGWLAWLFTHIMKLVGFRNRVAVFLEWAWAYVTYQRSVRLITGAGVREV